MSAPDKDYRMPDGGPSIVSLPKVSLHDHLDGGLRPQTIVELADEIGSNCPSRAAPTPSAAGSSRTPTRATCPTT